MLDQSFFASSQATCSPASPVAQTEQLQQVRICKPSDSAASHPDYSAQASQALARLDRLQLREQQREHLAAKAAHEANAPALAVAVQHAEAMHELVRQQLLRWHCRPDVTLPLDIARICKPHPQQPNVLLVYFTPSQLPASIDHPFDWRNYAADKNRNIITC